MEFLVKYGLTPSLMQQLQFGPIIFREEAVFRKEVKYGDVVSINLRLIKGRKDYSRWTIMHEIIKAEGIVCAILTIYGAWLDTKERKLFIPPAKAVEVFQQMPVGNNFEWLD
jgi:acyl-CoA thioester hydrolase